MVRLLAHLTPPNLQTVYFKPVWLVHDCCNSRNFTNVTNMIRQAANVPPLISHHLDTPILLPEKEYHSKDQMAADSREMRITPPRFVSAQQVLVRQIATPVQDIACTIILMV